MLLKFSRLPLPLIEVNDLLQVDKVKVFKGGTGLPPTYVSHLLELEHSRFCDSVLLCSPHKSLRNTNYFKPGENVDTLSYPNHLYFMLHCTTSIFLCVCIIVNIRSDENSICMDRALHRAIIFEV